MFQTKLTKMLGIDHPIIQGGMQNLGVPELAAAVSNAGGLGTINVTIYPTPDELRAAIRRTKELTDKPFCVNVSIIPSLSLGEATYKQLEVIFEEGVRVVETAGAGPQAFAPVIKKADIVWNHKAASVKHVKKAEDLGASGVTMGTRFVACRECPIHDNFKKWIVNAGENDTALCQQTIHNMVRVADNEAARKCRELEAKGAGLEELMTVISGKISKACFENGDVSGGMFAVGPAAGLIGEVKSAKEIVDDIITEARSVLLELNGLYRES